MKSLTHQKMKWKVWRTKRWNENCSMKSLTHQSEKLSFLRAAVNGDWSHTVLPARLILSILATFFGKFTNLACFSDLLLFVCTCKNWLLHRLWRRCNRDARKPFMIGSKKWNLSKIPELNFSTIWRAVLSNMKWRIIMHQVVPSFEVMVWSIPPTTPWDRRISIFVCFW